MLRAHPWGVFSVRGHAGADKRDRKKRARERLRQAGKDKRGQTKMLKKNNVQKNVRECGTGLWWILAIPQSSMSSVLMKQNSGDSSVSFSSKAEWSSADPVLRPTRSGWMKHSVWSSKQAPFHASSGKHSAHYQCARLEIIHSTSILSEKTH